MMNTRFLISLLATFLFTTSHHAQAQSAKIVYRIGYLTGTTQATESLRSERIRTALRELGYVEGQNIVIEYRYADNKLERLPELATELVRLKIDLIVPAGGDTVIRPAINATKTIPIVLIGAGSDAVKAGFIQSLARPGGNVTGVTSFTTALGGKRLELIKDAVAKATRVAVFYDPTAPGNLRETREELPAAALALKLTLQPWEILTAADLDKAFAALGKDRTDAIYSRQGGPGMRNVAEKRIAGFAVKNRIPSLFNNAEMVEAGGLMSYNADDRERFRRVASYIDRILKGTKPADLPVEQPSKFEFLVNLKTAKQIGLNFPPDLLARATRIIR